MKGLAILVLVLLMGIAAVACGGGECGVVEITGEELIEGALASFDAQETCRFEMDGVGNLKGTMDGQSVKMTISMDYAGVIDMVDQEMQADMAMTMDLSVGAQRQKVTIPMRMYFLGDMGYVGTEEPGQPEEWIKGDVSQELWESQEFQSQQVDLLRGAEVTILRTQSVRGTCCYVAEISPDMEMLLDMVSSLLGGGTGVELTTDSISNLECTGWYAQDTYFPMQSRVEYDVTFEEDQDRLTGHYIVSMVLYDYNESVSVQLPPEAEDAEDVGSLDSYMQ